MHCFYFVVVSETTAPVPGSPLFYHCFCWLAVCIFWFKNCHPLCPETKTHTIGKSKFKCGIRDLHKIQAAPFYGMCHSLCNAQHVIENLWKANGRTIFNGHDNVVSFPQSTTRKTSRPYVLFTCSNTNIVGLHTSMLPCMIPLYSSRYQEDPEKCPLCD